MTATGGSSGQTAQYKFTDAGAITGITVAPTTNTVVSGADHPQLRRHGHLQREQQHSDCLDHIYRNCAYGRHCDHAQRQHQWRRPPGTSNVTIATTCGTTLPGTYNFTITATGSGTSTGTATSTSQHAGRHCMRSGDRDCQSDYEHGCRGHYHRQLRHYDHVEWSDGSECDALDFIFAGGGDGDFRHAARCRRRRPSSHQDFESDHRDDLRHYASGDLHFHGNRDP